MSKFLTIIFVFLAITLVAQDQVNHTDALGRKQGWWQKKQDNGKLLYEGLFKDDEPVGEFKRYHPNGVIKAVINYPETSDSAQAKLFDERGMLIAAGVYVNQKKAGKWIYYQDKKLIGEEFYIDGLKNGKSKTYYPTGELLEEADWVDNLKNGIYRVYTKNGKAYFECGMIAGKNDGFCQVFHENGELQMEAFYRQNLRHDTWKFYDDQGNLSYELIYDMGELMNPEVRDSIDQIQLQEMEENKSKLIDPEKFIDNPMEYLKDPLSPDKL